VSFDKASEIDALMRRADITRDLHPMSNNWGEKKLSEKTIDDAIKDNDAETNGA
jgi:hypothetical protein